MNFGASLAKLAKALGKNVDELDSNDIQKAFKNTQESAPPSVLGQGKNLEALQKAKDEAADAVRVMDEPRYPKNITQDDLADIPGTTNKGDGFILKGDPESKDFTMSNPDAGALVPYRPNIPEATDFKTKSTISQQAKDSAIPTTSTSVFPSVVKELEFGGKKFNKKDLAKMLGAGGVGFAGLSALMGEEEQSVTPPLAPVAKKIEEKKPEEISPVSSSSSQKTKISTTQTMSSPQIQETEKEAGRDQVRDDLNDYVAELKKAQEEAKGDRKLAMMMEGAADIGAGLADIKADYGAAEALRAEAKTRIDDISQRIKAEGSVQDLKKLGAELADNDAMRDPNSAASKTTRQILKSMNVNVADNLSAMDIKNSGYLGNLLVTKASADMRKELKQMEVESKQDKDIEKLDKDQRDFAKSLRKEATTGAFGKQYATLSTGLRLGRAVEEFAKDPNGYSDYATLMSGLKTLQGDESVVREAEIRLGMSAGSLMDSLQNQVQRAMSGKSLQPAQRENILKAMRMLTEQSKRQYMDSIQPILEQADSEGVEHKYILPSGLVEAPKQKKQAVAKQTQSLPEGMVKVVRILDGEVRMLPADQASKLSKSKYKIGE